MTTTSSKKTVTLLIPETYRQVIQNSVGTRMFRNIYAHVNGRRQDILRQGQLSCAFFVSGILRLFDLTKTGHATVAGLIKDLENSGWKKIKQPKIGCVLLWDAVIYPDGQAHRHVGFYIAPGQAVSNSTTNGVPKKHHWTYGQTKGKPTRVVSAIYWHPRLA